ncbi:MAG TPA: hypothetical protein VH815_10305 [Acidobacteriota bacterium]|jgi:hypothetical protein
MPQEYNIGYNVETTAARWNNPQTSPFGNAIRGGFSPYGGVQYDWFQYDPYYWPLNYYGYQNVSVPPSEFLFGDYNGYRGILPYSLQSVSPEPYPYELPYPYNMSA